MDEPEESPTRPYWESARQRRLVVQRCTGCGRYRHPPTPACDACASAEAVWAETSGRGVVYAAVVVRAELSPTHRGVPYAGVAVELAEQPGLLVVARLVDLPVDDVQVGLSVEAIFEERPDGMVLPQFRPAPDRVTR